MSKSNNTRVNHNNHKVNNHIETTTQEDTIVMQTTTTEEVTMETNHEATPRDEINEVMEVLKLMVSLVKNELPAVTCRKEFLKLLIASDLSAAEQELALMEYTEMVATIEAAPPKRGATSTAENLDSEYLDSKSAYIINGRFATQQEAMSYFQAAHRD